MVIRGLKPIFRTNYKCRLVQDFRLQVEPETELPLIQQEERRRVFWSFYLCDKMISCGRERPAVILDDHCRLQLPTDEVEFRRGKFQQTPTLQRLVDENTFSVVATLCPFAVAVVMASLLGRCAQYALGEQEEQTSSGKTPPWNPRSKYSSIHSSLLQAELVIGFSDSLAEKVTLQCTDSDGVIDQHRAAPLVLSHALFFLCQCLLYHPFLLRQRIVRLGQRTPQSFLVQVFNSCREAATSLSRLMDQVKSLECENLSTSHDPFYGYCTMVSCLTLALCDGLSQTRLPGALHHFDARQNWQDIMNLTTRKVAGTIHSMFLQHLDPLIANDAAASFDSSLQHLHEMSCYWKSCGMMKSRLEDFRFSSGKLYIISSRVNCL